MYESCDDTPQDDESIIIARSPANVRQLNRICAGVIIVTVLVVGLYCGLTLAVGMQQSLTPVLPWLLAGGAFVCVLAIEITKRCRRDQVELCAKHMVVRRFGWSRSIIYDRIRSVMPRSDTNPIGTLLRSRIRSTFIPGTIIPFDDLAPMLKLMICPADGAVSDDIETTGPHVREVRSSRAMSVAGKFAMAALLLITGPTGILFLLCSNSNRQRTAMSPGFKVKHR